MRFTLRYLSTILHSRNAKLLLLCLIWLMGWQGTAAHAQVKWHPGHYYSAMYGAKKSAYTHASNTIYQELESNPALVGIQIRFKWHELETAKGVYNFKEIDEHLERLSTMGSRQKRFFIVIETRSFDTSSKLVPCYLTTSTCSGYSDTYEGGIFPYKKTAKGPQFGNGIRLWNDGVRNRFVKLMQALGNRYNAHSHFEGIGLGETSMGIPLNANDVSAADIDRYYAAHLYIQDAMSKAFPNTITLQFTNFPRNRLAGFIAGLQLSRTALGGPDILIDDPGLNAINIPNQQDGAYSYYPRLSGTVALAPSVMPSNYLNTSMDERVPSRQPSIDELLDFGRDRLLATHLFWSRDKPEYYYKEAFAKLQMLKINGDPRVELQTNCPSAYGSCITD